MLLHSGLSITEIAQNYGFQTAINFSTSFKQYTGLAPSNYRGANAY
ncbi:MAG: helix-turn-helix domain-containing protein [Vallitaleaceae bacterium]|nr:helix-turn-helix domain-containing protein [Vallitaleaceae bacterium]